MIGYLTGAVYAMSIFERNLTLSYKDQMFLCPTYFAPALFPPFFTWSIQKGI